MKKNQKSAFTLVELLVVISIIALLASLAIPMVGKAKQAANKLKDTSNMRQVGLALKLYASDYDGQYPLGWVNNSNVTDIAQASALANQGLRPLLALGICKDERIFNTPGVPYFKVGDNKLGNAPDFAEALAKKENSYSYIAGQSEASDSTDPLLLNSVYGQSGKIAGPQGDTPWTAEGLSPTINGGAGLNILYCDGSVGYVPKSGTTGKVTFGSTNLTTQLRVQIPEI
jgi:prepilin-type N-terminal cleavage/methylation domain-containing protein/prepilin-type processing-associated H-X9-DG protein